MKFLQSKMISKYDFVGTRLNIKKGSKQEGIDRFKKKFNPQLKKGYALSVIVRPLKYKMYKILSRLYFLIQGIKYNDPISQIKEEENTILLMGPRYNKKNPHMVSGTIILFEELIKIKSPLLYPKVCLSSSIYPVLLPIKKLFPFVF